MAEKILYYLGAGASAKALPLAKMRNADGIPIDSDPNSTTLPFALANFDVNNAIGRILSVSTVEGVHKFAEEFKEISKKGREFGDIDTYARYLNILNPGGSEIKNLKKCLSQFFSIKQILEEAIDPRYLPWLVNIMERRQFPDNVKIISWNYDYQVQLAANKIGPPEDVKHEGTGFTHSPSFLTYFPNLDPTFSDFNQLSLIHLNGIAGFAEMPFPKTGSIFQLANKGSKSSFFDFILNNDIATKLHFAWDRSGYHAKLMEHIKNMISGTTILVVIGYSFPFLNREVDKEIFQILRNDCPLQKIYYQDPFLTGENLRAQFGLPQDFEIVHIKDSNNFHIPFEY
ncbi:MAG: hypothetical protein ACRDE8_17995 [Ginsengibacter sp.]